MSDFESDVWWNDMFLLYLEKKYESCYFLTFLKVTYLYY